MKRLLINTGKPYEVVIEKGSLVNCGEIIKEKLRGRSVCVVTDSNVEKLYLDIVKESLQRSGFSVCKHVFTAGENSKNLESVAQIYKTLAENKLTRSDFIVALGGGVVGDMAGFAAATYLRGIEFVQIPTTFLAAIDSSVGGKTGVNIGKGKNLVGAFHQPSLVICDTQTFDTLGSHELADGVAEAVKYGVIRDEKLFDILENEDLKANLDDIILRSIAIKKDVVEKDELDLGERMILNFGHTFGHAVEKKTNHSVTHGHAVAMGMVIIEKIGEKLGITDSSVTKRTINCLKKHGLPTEINIDLDELAPICLNDKKRMGGSINLVFATGIGSCRISKISVSEFLKITSKEKDSLIKVCGKLTGEVDAPASKSDMHRIIICASLAKGETIIENFTLSDDINATIDIMKAMGAKIEILGDTIKVTGISTPNENFIADCNESGSTLRFLLPLFGGLGSTVEFRGSGKLPQRPLEPLKTQMEQHGISFTAEKLPLSVVGKLEGGEFILSGDVSSQFVSGLLFTLPLLDKDSVIRLTTPLQSKPYVDMTISALKKFGIEVEEKENCYHIKGRQQYISPKTIKADGDWSNGAFWIVAGAIGGDIKVNNLDINSLQGDKAICSVLKEMGAEIVVGDGFVKVKKSKLKAVTIDAKNIPDIVPILSIAAAFAEGTTTILNAQRLRIKESDRIASTKAMLEALGATAEETPDGLIIKGKGKLSSGKVDSCNDHRISMSAAIASTIVDKGCVDIINPYCVNKSYPKFFKDFIQFGGRVDVINLGE